MIIHKIVHSHEVESLTRDGWKFEQTLVASRIDFVNPITEGASHENNYTPKCHAFAGVVQDPLFVLSHESDAIDAMERLTKINESLVIRSDEAQRRADEWLGKYERLLKAAKDDEATLAAAQDRNRYLQTCLRKLESDLAKVRAAIGTKAYDEAISSS